MLPAVKCYEATLALAQDGALHISAFNQGFRANTRLAPAAAIRITDWLKSNQTEWVRDNVESPVMQDHISYSHETGKISLVTLGGIQEFDAHSDEALAKLVRALKRRAPVLRSDAEQELPAFLPTPTEEELGRRQILTNVASASGIKAYSKPQPRFNQSQISQAESKKRIDNILDDLFAQAVK